MHRKRCPETACQPCLALSCLVLPGPFRHLQNCQDSAFCTRLRGNTSEAFSILPESVAVEGARLTATVVSADDANATFRLVLTSYGDTLRLFIDEPAEKGRFQVPDVLVPGLEAREQVGRLRHALWERHARCSATPRIAYSVWVACLAADAASGTHIVRALGQPTGHADCRLCSARPVRLTHGRQQRCLTMRGAWKSRLRTSCSPKLPRLPCKLRPGPVMVPHQSGCPTVWCSNHDPSC